MKKKILITGARGQLGKEVAKIYDGEAELIKTDTCIDQENNIRYLDISNMDQVTDVILSYKPNVIINCAAMTNVDLCEKMQIDAIKANTLGPAYLAIACELFNSLEITFIHISTDYVFSGDRSISSFYGESDIPNPKTMYGKTKLLGEKIIKDACKRYFILRTAWLYGDGHNFVNTMLSLAKSKDEISVVDDQFGSPTSTIELAKVIKYLENTKQYGLYHATCEGSTNWAEFAEKIFSYIDKDVKVNHISSEEYKKINPDSADRPKNSILNNMELILKFGYEMSNWEDALDEYMRGL